MPKTITISIPQFLFFFISFACLYYHREIYSFISGINGNGLWGGLGFCLGCLYKFIKEQLPHHAAVALNYILNCQNKAITNYCISDLTQKITENRLDQTVEVDNVCFWNANCTREY